MALSCHMALGMLCQEAHEAWKLGDATKRILSLVGRGGAGVLPFVGI